MGTVILSCSSLEKYVAAAQECQGTSYPVVYLDSFIRRELANAPDEFHEAHLIGNIMGRFQLGIGDGWIANRIETMIKSGELKIVTQAPSDGPSYKRILRKAHPQNP